MLFSSSAPCPLSVVVLVGEGFFATVVVVVGFFTAGDTLIAVLILGDTRVGVDVFPLVKVGVFGVEAGDIRLVGLPFGGVGGHAGKSGLGLELGVVVLVVLGVLVFVLPDEGELVGDFDGSLSFDVPAAVVVALALDPLGFVVVILGGVLILLVLVGFAGFLSSVLSTTLFVSSCF